MDGFAKDLDFFKRKYTRHLGLQVENYTVAGMAKEEDLSASILATCISCQNPTASLIAGNSSWLYALKAVLNCFTSQRRPECTMTLPGWT